MALTNDELLVFRRLTNQIGANRSRLNILDAYYEGEQRLEQLGIAVPPELRKFVTILNWPRVTADAVEERIDVTGFRLAGQPKADSEMWRLWQANDLDEESQLAHLDALVFGRTFVSVGTNDDDDETPHIVAESAREMEVEYDPKTRKVAAALRVYNRDGVNRTSPAEFATLYLPDETIWLERPTRGGKWEEADRDDHGLGEVPVVPIVNRGRVGKRGGVSEIVDVITPTDAAARALTNAQLATETLAVPMRFVLNATKGDFVDQKGEPLTAWEAYFGVFAALANKDADVKQLPAADLRNFTEIVNHYAQQVAGVTGLPMRYFGQNTANPPSADAIRADESRLVKKCERKQRAWSGSWEQVMRLARRFQTGEWDDKLKTMETMWADPATPTKAQQADAIVKLRTEGILPLEAAWEELGYSPERIIKLREMMEAEAVDPILGRINRPPREEPTGGDTGGSGVGV